MISRLRHFISTLYTGALFFGDRSQSEVELGNQLLFSPLLAQLVVTRRCNLSCRYCDEFDSTSEPVPKSVLIERLQKLRSLGTLSIEFTGGEPLLHPDLFDIIRYATDLNFPARMLISNGLLLDSETIHALNAAGLTHLQISIDGAHTNNVTQKTLDVLQSRLDRLAEMADFRVVLSGVLGSCPPEETLKVIKFAKQREFIPRVLLLHDRNGQLHISQKEKEMYRQIQRFIGKNIEEANSYRERLLENKPAPFKCRAGSRYLYIDEKGNVHWCSRKRKELNKPLLDYSLKDLKKQFYIRKRGCESFCTLGCARTSSKLDERREQNIFLAH